MPWLTLLGRPQVQAESMVCASRRGTASTPVAAWGGRPELLMNSSHGCTHLVYEGWLVMAMCILQRQTIVLPMQHSSSSTRRRTAEIADPEQGEEEDKAGKGGGVVGKGKQVGWATSERSQEGEDRER